MSGESDQSADRENTDQSLRTERKNIDRAIRELVDIDEIADAAISRARLRADEVLAAARARDDHRIAAIGSRPGDSGILRQTRSLEDQALRDERDEADHALHDARANKVSQLASERRETDNDLVSERAQADEVLASRDQVLQIVSHDLRNMLLTITGSAHLIDEDAGVAGSEAAIRQAANWIQRAGARMNRLIGDLLDVASIDAGKLAVTLESADPAAIVVEAVETFRTLTGESRVSVTAEVPSQLPRVFCDPARILQVLTNLLGNAIKFTPDGGTVVVRVEHVGGEIRFSVSDTGIGIAPGSLDRVFVRYVQLATGDRRGAGLGLYLSRSIIESHGGRIWAESVVGKGSTFFFTLLS